MKKKIEHTPLPWTLLSARTLVNIKGPEGRQIGQLPINSPDAEFIVRAVNAHDELVAALKSTLLYIDTYSDEAKANFRAGGNGKYYDDLIAKAEGK